MAKISLSVEVVNDKGKVRLNNEDNLFANGDYIEKENMDEGFVIEKVYNEAHALFAVCDGMGGEDNGEVASHALASNLYRINAPKYFSQDALLQKSILELNQVVFDACEGGDNKRSGGTTLSALQICDGKYRSINVGDSRVYLLRFGRLKQLTKDDTEVQRMVDFGFLKPDKVRTHPKRHVINKFMGMNPKSIVMDATLTKKGKLRNGDVFVICSDGLCDMLLDEEIARVLKKGGKAQDLVNKALEAGGKDNCTVLVVRVHKSFW